MTEIDYQKYMINLFDFKTTESSILSINLLKYALVNVDRINGRLKLIEYIPDKFGKK